MGPCGWGALAALLDINGGEGGAVRDISVLQGEGDPLCIAFDGELLAVGTSSGAVVTWNVAESYSAGTEGVPPPYHTCGG